jgi:DNA-binding NarL/FixJ family response regulator
MRSAHSPIRVFVVEDSALVRERLISDLRSIGRFKVVGFADSERPAITAIQSLQPDIVITDLQLKEGSGIEVLRQVRAQPSRSVPRVFVLTNYALPEYKRRCLESGADEFLDKSSEYDRFLALMTEVA